ncbi:MAG: T9SS type A sorting domain-containing protein [Candidatus Delongbacteria bacterium]|nr:T9SS type A sorting domain-containing protein [Candidatus Delongbacteria bacterium]
MVNKKFSAGKHTINFDGTSLNSGVYFYKLDAENKQIVKKMTLVK